MTRRMRLLARWYSDQHCTAEQLWDAGFSTVGYFGAAMRDNPGRWLERDRIARSVA